MPWFGNQHDLADAALQRNIGLSMQELGPLFRQGGDPAELKFMECCRCLWKVDGAQLMEPFIETFFNTLPEPSRNVLFQRMMTIVYVAQDEETKPAKSRAPVTGAGPARQREEAAPTRTWAQRSEPPIGR